MAILLNNNGYDNESWRRELKNLLPEKDIFLHSEIKSLQDIEYAVIWNHPYGDLDKYLNLKGILLLGAGTEHIDEDTSVPDVPIVRLIDPEVLKDMSLYSLYWVMHLHRGYETYKQQQSQHYWQRHEVCRSKSFMTTVLGLGAVGKAVANRLHINGFTVTGWDKFTQELPQELDSVNCYYDTDGLNKAIEKADVIINCLPLNKSTYHFIDSNFFRKLPKGSSLINISRGDVINDKDLIGYLNDNHIANAILDTFSVEPLPQESLLWSHPKVTVTPHMSGATYARSAAKVVADNIYRIENGEEPFPLHNHPLKNYKNKLI